MNKLKGFGLDWMVVRSGGDLCVIIPKVYKYLWLLYYTNLLEGKLRPKILLFSFLFPDSAHPLYLHLSPNFFLLKILQHLFLLTIKVSFLNFYTCSSCFDGMIVDVSYSNLEKYFIVMNLCLFDMEYQGFEVIY